MRQPLAWFLWLGFALLVVAIMHLLLRACAIAIPGLPASWSYCAPSTAIGSRAEERLERLQEVAQRLELSMTRRQAECLISLRARSQPTVPPAVSRPAPGRSESTEASRQPEWDPAPSPTHGSSPVRPEAKQPSVDKPAPADGTPVAAGPFAFLSGCWHSEPFRFSAGLPEGTSTYCFDQSGTGELVHRRPSAPAYECRMPVTATGTVGRLALQDSDTTCSDGSLWYADHLECKVSDPTAIQCRGNSQGAGGTPPFAVILRKQN